VTTRDTSRTDTAVAADGPRPPTRGRKSNSASRSTEARQRILDAAQALFAERGFDATATKAIAEQAGVPSGLIFYHFRTKDELLATLIEERSILPELHAALTERPHADPETALVEVGRRLVAAFRRRDELGRILFRESMTHPDVAARFRELREEGIGTLSAYLDEAVRDGRLRPVDTRHLAWLFLASVFFAAFVERPPDPDRLVRETVATLLRGLVPAEA